MQLSGIEIEASGFVRPEPIPEDPVQTRSEIDERFIKALNNGNALIKEMRKRMGEKQ